MKKILTFALMLAGCAGTGKKLPSTGAPYEVIVAITDADWRAAGLGDTIKSVLGAAIPFINSYEPQFDAYRILPERLVDVARRNGDVVVVTIDSTKYTRPDLVARPDEFAHPQLVVYAVAPDATSLAGYIHEHGDELRAMFNDVERDRWVAAARKSPATNLQGVVREKFGFGMALPIGMIMGKESADFLWMRFRYPEADQELSIYSYPVDGTPTLGSLIEARDRFVSLIPGEVPDSHMITVREPAEPNLDTVTINGRQWFEVRGLWEVKNDFMGGAFVNYSTIVDGRVITIDGAVFSPSPYKLKRSLLRQLESLVHSVEF